MHNIPGSNHKFQ